MLLKCEEILFIDGKCYEINWSRSIYVLDLSTTGSLAVPNIILEKKYLGLNTTKLLQNFSPYFFFHFTPTGQMDFELSMASCKVLTWQLNLQYFVTDAYFQCISRTF